MAGQKCAYKALNLAGDPISTVHCSRVKVISDRVLRELNVSAYQGCALTFQPQCVLYNLRTLGERVC